MDIQFPSDIQVRYRGGPRRVPVRTPLGGGGGGGHHSLIKQNYSSQASPSPLPVDFEGQGTLLRKGVERAPRRTQAYPRSF